MPSKILLVDDDPRAIRQMGKILSSEGSIRFATNGEDALRLARESPPDLIVLDADMPGMSGFELCALLKHDANLESTPVVFVTSHRDEAFELRGFDVGGSDFITKPVNPRLMLVRASAQLRVKRMADALRISAATDALTRLPNRRALDEALQREWLRAQRSDAPLAFILADVDHFKNYNDHYGHPAGDACLRAVAGALAEACKRPADFVARYGGEEFALLLPETDPRGALFVAERMLKNVRALGVAHAKSSAGSVVTVSAGVACQQATAGHVGHTPAPRQPIAALIERADRALYEAKHAGRDQVHLAETRTLG